MPGNDFEIELSPEILDKLRQVAARRGVSVPDLIAQIIKTKLAEADAAGEIKLADDE